MALGKEFDGFDYSKLNFPIHPQEPTKIRVQYLKNHLGHRLSYANEPNIFDEFVMLKGLLNRIDYAASVKIFFNIGEKIILLLTGMIYKIGLIKIEMRVLL